MSGYDEAVNRQYGRSQLSQQVIDALVAAGKDMDNLSRDDLSAFDEFHIGGVAETRTLAGRIPDLQAGTQVLDVGSGLGGPARTLAAEYGCEVVGIDLTAAYCEVAQVLTERVGLATQVGYRQGNALDMPFEDASFDVVWTQFAGMNIGDKERLYDQCRRVLRPGGYFALHEVMAGDTDELIYPVFWADHAAVNFLQPPQRVRQMIADGGFEEVAWLNLTQDSTEWFEQIIAQRSQQSSAPPLGFNIFVGEQTGLKAANIIQNLREGRITVFQAVFQAA